MERISSKGERTRKNKLKWSRWSYFLPRKSMKSMKERRPEAARLKDRRRFPILFQIKAKMEQIGNEQAVLEQFDISERRQVSTKDAHFELIWNQSNQVGICYAAEPLCFGRRSKGAIGERTWQIRSKRRTN